MIVKTERLQHFCLGKIMELWRVIFWFCAHYKMQSKSSCACAQFMSLHTRECAYFHETLSVMEQLKELMIKPGWIGVASVQNDGFWHRSEDFCPA